ncbi:MAG TPA: hypothetical protein VFI31_09735 [Pirellulales bacterium]|nr:hypothetical protein [Pirellulales bacterium]
MTAPKLPDDGFGRVARQIADWTTKGLFSALVLVAGLGFGRQVIRWWRADDLQDAEPPLAAPFDPADPTQPVDVALGDLPYRLVRQTVVGDQQEAMEALRTACGHLLNSAPAWSPRADANEQSLLERLAELEQTTIVPQNDAGPASGGRLYEPAPGLPLIVGTRRQIAEHRSSNATAGQNRVILWGLASPAGEKKWTLCLFQANPRGASDVQREVPLPAGCQRLLALRQSGNEISVFQGPDTCLQYRDFFTAWQREQQPGGELRWQPTADGGWYGSLRRGPAESDVPAGAFVVQLVPGRLGGCTGLLQRVQGSGFRVP